MLVTKDSWIFSLSPCLAGPRQGRNRASSIEHLPILPKLPSNLQPVALVSVDADKEKLNVVQFNQTEQQKQNPKKQPKTTKK